jgi:hypothetical protein
MHEHRTLSWQVEDFKEAGFLKICIELSVNEGKILM